MNESIIIEQVIFYSNSSAQNINESTLSLKDWLVFLGVIVGSFLTFSSSFVLDRFRYKADYAKEKLNKRWSTFSILKGLQSALSQNLFDFYRIQIMSVYHQKAFELADSNHKDNLSKDMEKNRDIYENSVAKLAETKQKFFENVGLLFLLYKDTNEIRRMADSFHKNFSCFSRFEGNKLRDKVRFINTFNELNTWRDEEINELKRMTRDCVSYPIEQLLNYLQKEIESDNNQHWWKFW